MCGNCFNSSHKRAAYYIQSGGFDDLMLRVGLHCLSGAAVDEARQLMEANAPTPTEAKVDFALPEMPACGVIRSNAYPLTPPSEIHEFDLKEWPEKGKVWKYFDDCTEGRAIVAAPLAGKGYAFGTIEDINAAFADRIGPKVERVPISERDLSIENSIISNLIRRIVVITLASKACVETDGHEILWEKAARERRRGEDGKNYLVHDALVVYLRWVAGRTYIVLQPTVKIESASGGEVPEDVGRNIKMSILGWQHNNKFHAALMTWQSKLFSDESFEFPIGSGLPFRFQLKKNPVFAKITSSDRARQIELKPGFLSTIAHTGIELTEPNLLFSDRVGTGLAADPHPVRGIVSNQPYDYALSTRKLAPTIQLGVICPAKEARRLSEYLQRFHQSISPGKYEADYLPPFPGFQGAFGVSLQIPSPGDNLWLTCPEINPDLDEQRGALQLSQHVTSCLSALKAAALPNLTIVFIPMRWARWRKFETESEAFDLHNFVKAFCVPQGIATQFLEEDTLTNDLQCRIRWWLSLALYVKSMRTPWVLASLDGNSAFVGLGISVDRKAERGKHVLLGCSHLYNAQGQGLQFRLSKIENPFFRGRNAFMSQEDARRVGETIRQLFWESHFKLPERVVIHKQTEFTDDERKGLQAGLSGIKQIDLLEIHVDRALRYLASTPKPDGSFEVDGFPVKRGTLLKIDQDAALLWVHGVSRAVNPRQNYYQGKRRIPAPLLIRRHAGRSDLSIVGDEILGLSKMNWNSFDLYAKLPATVETSKQIARIGALLERFGSESYDYRLFM
jgi:hypothetical protein